MTLDDLCSRLLPPDEHLHFETLILEDHSLTLVAAMTAPKAVCPDCHQPSQRRHSGYPRTLADLPWALMPVALVLHVRRFFCDTSGCGRLTFTERLPTVAPLYARTTTRLRHSQASTGLALGGAAGARQLARQSLPGSRNTVLRRVRSLSTPAYPPPHVVGIDDWAWRTGHRYGTIVVDLERGCPIDVLEDRLADTVAAWFKAHPEVNVVARDRAESYAAGMRQGAPEAVQVADRFHLMQNVAAALEQVFSAHHQDLEALNAAQRQALVTRDDGSVAVPVSPPPRPPTAQERAESSRARRLALYENIWELRRQDWSADAIARQLGVHRSTVFRSVQQPTFPERKERRGKGRSVLGPYKDYLVQRWNDGCLNARRLFREITAQGYPGCYNTVVQYTQRLRQALELPARHRTPRQPRPEVAEPTTPPLTVRGATGLILKREENRDEDDKQQIIQLQAQHAELAEAIALTQDFAALVRQRQGDELQSWLQRAATSCLRPFQGFANGLWEDYEAVKAGLTLPWSTGPVEGQINRLKMLKRQMFGRANIDLLRLRVLYHT
jgi:transposase